MLLNIVEHVLGEFFQPTGTSLCVAGRSESLVERRIHQRI